MTQLPRKRQLPTNPTSKGPLHPGRNGGAHRREACQSMKQNDAQNSSETTADQHHVRQLLTSARQELPTSIMWVNCQKAQPPRGRCPQAATGQPPAKACQSIIRQNYREALCATTVDKHHVRQLPTTARQNYRQTLCEATADKHHVRQLPIHYKTELPTNIM